MFVHRIVIGRFKVVVRISCIKKIHKKEAINQVVSAGIFIRVINAVG